MATTAIDQCTQSKERVMNFMQMENVDHSMLLLALVPQSKLQICPLFGFSIEGKTYGMRMHPLFPVLLLDQFDEGMVDKTSRMVKKEYHPMIRELFAEACKESPLVNCWFPCPPPISVYGEDIRCLCVKFSTNITDKDLIQRLMHMLINVLSSFKTPLPPAIFVRTMELCGNVTLHTSLLMRQSQCEEVHNMLVNHAFKQRDGETLSICMNPYIPFIRTGGKTTRVTDYLLQTSCQEGVSPECLRSFDYEQERFQDAEYIMQLPVDASAMAPYLNFLQF
ncbi:hypothetical protein GUITHDRAFT_145564 [Guillardia theta CCMP2712]|uniref:Uncharacterized protein n=1 Tax=Guillardia theta (strain CCMP2712) TaxID=905079 RepID=L1ILN6_GUITC|nr:hypothetical protein GUITHDRAFT_145564 [Guillardia theta CCMP2712]EKX36715.1 hypothetical protein GUITHDRAFT_145564 [Guillardia theta CCMP2712]|eukprot:XP_005823695.1 hypothetical protein GUITHDRAFT_145564 [Guillardia theta CCMP2712]